MSQASLEQLQDKFSQIQQSFGEFATLGHAFISQAEPTTAIPFVGLVAIFLLACFVGYYVVWSVTPALHSPLMAVTNAISSVIIVGAIIAAGPQQFSLSSLFGFIALVLAAVNIFGGFIVTQRMLGMFKKKPKSKEKK